MTLYMTSFLLSEKQEKTNIDSRNCNFYSKQVVYYYLLRTDWWREFWLSGAYTLKLLLVSKALVDSSLFYCRPTWLPFETIFYLETVLAYAEEVSQSDITGNEDD